MRWLRQGRAHDEAVSRLDGLRQTSDRTSASVERLLAQIDDERSVGQRRLTWSVAIASVLFVGAGICGAGLLFASSEETPTASPTGRIGVVLLDDPKESIVQVAATFSASIEDASTFDINVSVLPVPARNLNSDDFETRVGFIFCGPIRDGLTVVEWNEGAQASPSPVTTSSFESDTLLGDRTDCSYLEVVSTSAQVLLTGETNAVFAVTSGERVRYAFPGVTTTQFAEEFNDVATLPLPEGAVLNVALSNVPPDLQIVQAAPQIPSDGLFSWESAVGYEPQPVEYRLAGLLEDRQTSGRVAVFAAGALVGVAGAALLWVVEALTGLISRPKRQ